MKPIPLTSDHPGFLVAEDGCDLWWCASIEEVCISIEPADLESAEFWVMSVDGTTALDLSVRLVKGRIMSDYGPIEASAHAATPDDLQQGMKIIKCWFDHQNIAVPNRPLEALRLAADMLRPL